MTRRPAASALERLLATERRRERPRLLQAAAMAAIVGAATVLLLGLSGWFITAAALAGSAGPLVARSFNTLLPSACIRLLAILRTGGRYGERLQGHDGALRMMARLRPALYGALAAGPVRSAMSLSIGDAAARVVQDVAEVEAAIIRRSASWAAAGACAGGIALLAGCGVATAALAGAALVVVLVGGRGLARAAVRHGRLVPAAHGSLKQEFAALAGAAAELRVYGLEDWAAARIDATGDRLACAQQREARSQVWQELLLAGMAGLVAMLVLAVAGCSAQVGPGLARAAMAALGGAVMMERVGGLVRGWQSQGRLHAAMTRLDALLVPPPAGQARPVAPGVLPSITLRPFDARLAPGMMIGLRGPSGCGKTSLLEALVGLREPPRTHILLDGIDLRDIPPDGRRTCFSLAPQEPGLLAGTVREALQLGDPQATEPQMWEALHDAVLDQRIRHLPDGLDAWIGDGGMRLSAGEQRRLALARAYLRAAPWLLLDEPTAGLDEQTERLVVDRLRNRAGRTGQGVLLVSHASAPLAACKRIVTFDRNQALSGAG